MQYCVSDGSAGKACCHVCTRGLARTTAFWKGGIPAPPSHICAACVVLALSSGSLAGWVCGCVPTGRQERTESRWYPKHRPHLKDKAGGVFFGRNDCPRDSSRGRHKGCCEPKGKLVTNHKPGNKEKIDDAKHEQEGEEDYNSTHNKRIRMPESEQEESIWRGGMGGRLGLNGKFEETVV